MNNIIFDNLKHNHLDSLCELEKMCFSIPWTRTMFEGDVTNHTAYYVLALDGSKVVGYCGLYKVLDESDITNIAVHPDYRRQGLASQLMNHIFDYCHKCNLGSVTLEVRESNLNAINLYKKHGFHIVGKRKNYYSDTHEDAILMTKYLKEV